VHASAIQVVVLLISAPLAVRWWGVTGIAWSMTLGLGCAAAWMLYRTLRARTA
jgi:PST family polysaccharide transporter